MCSKSRQIVEWEKGKYREEFLWKELDGVRMFGFTMKGV